MLTPDAIMVLLIAVTIVLAAVILFYPGVTRQRGGKVLAFFPLFLLPIAIGAFEGIFHLEKSKETGFCLSCHVMNDHGRSLYRDDSAFIPAAHFQNHRVPTESACFTCHTDYTMYGDFTAKLRGLQHVYVQYLGTVPNPSEIKLYTPYNNRECLHCHEGARNFEEGVVHSADEDTLEAIKANKLSCISSGCHDKVHEVGGLNGAKMWSPSQQ
jgi:cytochrome c-type protein NapC